MTEKKEKTILELIEKVIKKSENSELHKSVFVKCDKELTILSEYFKLNKIQSFFAAILIVLPYNGNDRFHNSMSIKDHLNCNPVKILRYYNDLDVLFKKGFFGEIINGEHLDISSGNVKFNSDERILNAIIKNEPMPNLSPKPVVNIFDFFERIYYFFEELGRDNNDRKLDIIFKNVEDLSKKFKKYPIVKYVESLKLDIRDVSFYYILIWTDITKIINYEIDAHSIARMLYNSQKMVYKYLNSLLIEKNALITNGLIEINKREFVSDSNVNLTSNSYKLLRDSGIELKVEESINEFVVLPENIAPRELIFNKIDMEQVFVIKDLLSKKKINEIQSRLSDKNLSKGIAILLHGLPGTGKTELVLQIAKETNRKIMKVDVSKLKSMWFGKSEELVKQVFTDYNRMVEKCDQMPILFINEADALLSKRRSIGNENSNVRQTENTIQNILLEEIENLKGILIATTNLIDNIDIAFERRFLYKINFKMPDNNERSKIWAIKFPYLNDDDCSLLANRFMLSGGQIDNIYRKSEINEILNGDKADIEKIMVYCAEEKMRDDFNGIGFNK